MVYRQLRHWMEQHLGMHFGPHATPLPTNEPSTASEPPATSVASTTGPSTADEPPAVAEMPAEETPAAG
jgi:hypothetical protein